MKSFSQFIIEKKYFPNNSSGGYSSSPSSQETINRLNKLFDLDLDSAEEKGRKRSEIKKNNLSNKKGISSGPPTPNTQSGNKNRISKKFGDIWDKENDTNIKNDVVKDTQKTVDKTKYNRRETTPLTKRDRNRVFGFRKDNKNSAGGFNSRQVTTNTSNVNYQTPKKTQNYTRFIPKSIRQNQTFKQWKTRLNSPAVKSVANSKVTKAVTKGSNPVLTAWNLASTYNQARDQGRSRVGAASKAILSTAAFYKGATVGAGLMAPVPVPGARIAGGIVGGSTASAVTSTAFDKLFPVKRNKVATATPNPKTNNKDAFPIDGKKKKNKFYIPKRSGIAI